MNASRLSPRRMLPLTAMLVAVVALSACSSDSKSSSDTSTSTSTAATTTAAIIKTANNGTLGKILVDSSGKTVYTLTKDGAAVACTGACLNAWPPVLLPAGTTKATGATGVKSIGVVTADGGKQVTIKSLPVYTFSGDRAAGDATGDGLSSFGGTWHVVTLSGGAATSDTSSTTSSSGY